MIDNLNEDDNDEQFKSSGRKREKAFIKGRSLFLTSVKIICKHSLISICMCIYIYIYMKNVHMHISLTTG